MYLKNEREFISGTAVADYGGVQAFGGRSMPRTVIEERTVYMPSRYRQVRCRLWYEVTPFRDGMFRYFLVGIQELE